MESAILKCASHKILENMIIFGNNKHDFCNQILENLYGPHVNVFTLNTGQFNDIGLKTLRNHIISFIDAESFFPNPASFKCVIFTDMNKLSIEIQYALRRIVEIYTNIRFIFLTNDIHNIHASLLSRLLIIRLKYIPPPSLNYEKTDEHLYNWLEMNYTHPLAPLLDKSLDIHLPQKLITMMQNIHATPFNGSCILGNL